MSLRRRMVVLTAAAVALAVILSAGAGYVAVESSLRSRVDRQIKELAGDVKIVARFAGRDPGRLQGVARRPNLAPGQLVKAGLGTRGDGAVFTAAGRIYKSPGDKTKITLVRSDLEVARGTAPAYFRTTRIDGADARLYIAPAGEGRAVITAQSLTDLNETLRRLAAILIVICLAGIGLAGLLGLFVARAAARPVHDLRRAAEHVGFTGDLSRRIRTRGSDDLSRLGDAFNSMLASLSRSQLAQTHLIADASHELRTPIATLRTNLEVLARNPDMPASDRTPLLGDLAGQSAELGALVDDLLVSARAKQEMANPTRLAMDELVMAEVERCRSQHADVRVDVDLQSCEVRGSESGLRRAVANLLDNAVKWSPPAGTVHVSLSAGRLAVRDEGPGFLEEDLHRVFDRFYRSPVVRTVPGSGLGLAIVQKVADEHAGAVVAMNAPDGGAEVVLSVAPAANGRGPV